MSDTHSPPTLIRARGMLILIAVGLFFFGVTVWPAVWELKFAVQTVWGESSPTGAIHGFLLKVIEALESTESNYPFLLYGYDWLVFAHLMLAILFAGAARNPIRNIWIVQFGLIMCALIPILAVICIPLRGIPFAWFWIDFAFAPGAAFPLYIALRNIKRAEKAS